MGIQEGVHVPLGARRVITKGGPNILNIWESDIPSTSERHFMSATLQRYKSNLICPAGRLLVAVLCWKVQTNSIRKKIIKKMSQQDVGSTNQLNEQVHTTQSWDLVCQIRGPSRVWVQMDIYSIQSISSQLSDVSLSKAHHPTYHLDVCGGKNKQILTLSLSHFGGKW